MILASTLSLCLIACQSAAPSASEPKSVQISAADSSASDGHSTKVVLSGPPSWETPLKWQIYDSFVVQEGSAQKVKGHKGKRVIIPVTLTNTDGTEAVLQFLVDTGADRTVVNTKKVRANLQNARVEQASGVGGLQEMRVVAVPRLTVGTLVQENAEVAFTEMPVDVEGLLGQDFLRHYSVTIDYQHGIFRLERSERKERK